MAVEEVEANADAAAEATAVRSAAAGDVVRYPVAPGYRVNVRSGPGRQYRLIRTLPYDVRVPVYCQKPGEKVTGPYGTTTLWDNIADGEYVSDAYVKTGRDGYVAPRCS